MHVERFHINELTDIDRQAISKLCLENGNLWPTFLAQESSPDKIFPAQVFLARDDFVVIGWALVYCFREPHHVGRRIDFQVYVDENYRRLGVGTELLKTARTFNQYVELNVTPWDDASAFFYKSIRST